MMKKYDISKVWRKIRILVISICIMMFIISVLGNTIFSLNRKTVTVNPDYAYPVSLKTGEIEQELIVEGKLTYLNLLVETPNSGSYDGAGVVVTLSQGNAIYEYTYDADEINDGWIRINTFTANFQIGKVIVQVKALGVPDTSDVFCYASSSKNNGLASATYRGNALPNAIALNYDVFSFDSYFYYYIILLILCFAAIYRIISNLYNRKNSNEFYFLTACLVFVIVSINNPTASVLGEPRSEAAYEFWYKAHYLSFVDNMMSLMSGESLAWTERLFMWVADMASPTKYVFGFAQTLQLMFISLISSMLTLKTFDRFMNIRFRIVASLIIGTSLLFPSAYLFWAVSYWAMIFLFFYGFTDFEKENRAVYILGLIFSVILCVSRIYHAVFIVASLFALIMLWNRGKRFRIYCITICAGSLFEVVYSFAKGAGEHISSSNKVSFIRVIANTVYYQCQVISSMLIGKVEKNGLLANVMAIMLLLSVILLFINMLKKGKNAEATVLGIAGMVSIGTIMINVITSAKTDSVAMATDYYAKADWFRQYYQCGDLHFSYAYFSLFIILLMLFYLMIHGLQSKKMDNNTLIYSSGIIYIMVCLSIIVHNFSNGDFLKFIETDWKNVSYVTGNESYYIPINVSYGVAKISLEKNSYGVIYGRTDTGEEYEWNEGGMEYSHTYEYSNANVGKVCNLLDKGILEITVRRSEVNISFPYYIVCYDVNGEVICRQGQTNSCDRIMTDFYFDEPLMGVDRIAFESETGDEVYITDAIQIGVAR